MRILLLSFILLIRGEVIDRVAVGIGNQVITESQLIEEIRLDSFLSNEVPNLTASAKRNAADRLIEQKLVRKEMEMGRYPSAAPEEASAIVQNLLKTRASGDAEFDRQLTAAGITRDQLEQHLLWGLTLSRFIDLRFRPAVQVTTGDIEKYYREKVLAEAGVQKPSLEDARARILEVLQAQRADAGLDTWLKETRSRTAIEYRKEVFEQLDPK